MKIRPFDPTPAEYEAIIRLRNAIQPDNPSAVAIWQHWDQNRNPDEVFQRFVAEQEDELLAYGHYGETAVNSGSFHLEVQIHPAHQGGGLTARLYNHLIAAVQAHQPQRLITQIREHETMKLHWLRQNGFEQGKRYPVSHLDVARFDAAPYADVLASVAASGIEIISFAELAQIDPDWQRQVYELDYILMSDVPLVEPYVKRPFPQFVKDEFEHPNFLPAAWFVACDGQQYVGMTGLVMRGGQAQRLATAITGVVRSYRRRGIATALKVTSFQFAQQIGSQIIETGNEENNPMYRLNLSLGFVPQPAWLDFVRQL